MRRLTIMAVLGYGLCVGCFPTSYASQPELELTAVDGSGKPIPDAEVVTYSWSNPHHRLDHEQALVTDAAGKATSSGKSESEWSAPLCIHGIAAHQMNVCVSKPGFRAAYFELTDPGAATTITVKLTADPAGTPCEYEGGRFGGDKRPDITGPNVHHEGWEVDPAAKASAAASASAATAASASASGSGAPIGGASAAASPSAAASGSAAANAVTSGGAAPAVD